MFWLFPLLQADAQTRSLGGTVSYTEAVCTFCSHPAVDNRVSLWQARGSNKQDPPQPSGQAEVCLNPPNCVNFPVWAAWNLIGQYFGWLAAGEPFGYQPTGPCCRCPRSCSWSCCGRSSRRSRRSRQSQRCCACECWVNFPRRVNWFDWFCRSSLRTFWEKQFLFLTRETFTGQLGDDVMTSGPDWCIYHFRSWYLLETTMMTTMTTKQMADRFKLYYCTIQSFNRTYSLYYPVFIVSVWLSVLKLYLSSTVIKKFSDRWGQTSAGEEQPANTSYFLKFGEAQMLCRVF